MVLSLSFKDNIHVITFGEQINVPRLLVYSLKEAFFLHALKCVKC